MQRRRRPTDHRSRQCCFAGTTLAQYAKHTARVNVEIDAVEDGRPLAISDQVYRQTANPKQGLGHQIAPRSSMLRARSTQAPIRLMPSSVANRNRPGMVGIHQPLIR